MEVIMRTRAISKRTHTVNATLPNDVCENLDSYSKKFGKPKNQILTTALRQYFAFKKEEDDFRQENQGHRIKKRMIFEAVPRNEEGNLASVLIY
jgi:predicted DNA-binding protein